MTIFGIVNTSVFGTALFIESAVNCEWRKRKKQYKELINLLRISSGGMLWHLVICKRRRGIETRDGPCY